MENQLSILVTFNDEGDDWNVWISLPDHDPVLDPYGFVVGNGDTRQSAVAKAVESLENALERLQSSSPSGVLERRSGR